MEKMIKFYIWYTVKIKGRYMTNNEFDNCLCKFIELDNLKTKR